MKKSRYSKFIKNRILMFCVLLLIVCISFGVSYSNFIFNGEEHRAVEMYVGGLKYNMSLDGTNTKQTQVPPGLSIITVDFTSSDPVDYYYKLSYLNDSNVTVKNIYGNIEGLIQPDVTEQAILIINNESGNELTLNLKLNTGYQTNDLSDVIVDAGYNLIPQVQELSLTSEEAAYLGYITAPIGLNNKFLEITGYTSNSLNNIVIPSYIDGKKVVSIASEAFNNHSEINDIQLPSTLLNVYNDSFTGTTWYTNLVASSSNHVIIHDGILIDGSAASGSITIPNSVNIIASNAFKNNNNITSVNIINGLAQINQDAFYGCSNLSQINFPDSIMYIDDDALTGTAWLDEETVPDPFINDYPGIINMTVFGDTNQNVSDFTSVTGTYNNFTVYMVSDGYSYTSNNVSVTFNNGISSLSNLVINGTTMNFDSSDPNTTVTINKTEYEVNILSAVVENGIPILSVKLIPPNMVQTYILTCDANGGSVSPKKKKIIYNGTYGALPTPTRIGYTFNGWYTSASGGTQVSTTTRLTTESNVTVYAHWTAYRYTIKYNANGGSNTMSTTSCTYGTDCALRSNAFTRTGHTFLGWSENSAAAEADYGNLTTVLNLSTTNNATVNLYAIWRPNQYTVVYNNNGGSGSMENSLCSYGNTCTLRSNTLTRTGYTFLGWSKSSTATTATYSDGQGTSNLSTTDGATVNLYAVWKVNTFTIKYNSNGGSGTMSNTSCTYGTTCTLRSNAYTKSGNTFLGWSESSTATTATYANKANVNGITDANGVTITLYAVWEPNHYTIAYNANSGSGSMSSTSCDYGVNCTLRTNTLTRTGYHFLGWSKTSTATSATYTDGQTVSNLTSTNNGTVTLYAIWAKNTYTIKYNNNGGSGTMSNTSCTYGTSCKLRTNTFTKTNYGFIGWNTNSSATTATYTDGQSVSNLTSEHAATVNLYAIWSNARYTLTYSGTGSSQCTNKTALVGTAWGTLCSPTRSNYDFDGWYTSGGSRVTSSTKATSNLTVYAEWSLRETAPDCDIIMSPRSFSCGQSASVTLYGDCDTPLTSVYWEGFKYGDGPGRVVDTYLASIPSNTTIGTTCTSSSNWRGTNYITLTACSAGGCADFSVSYTVN